MLPVSLKNQQSNFHQDLFLFNTCCWHRNLRVYYFMSHLRFALFKSASCLDTMAGFNSTRKFCGVSSFLSYQSSPFCHSDISDTVVLKTRYHIGHIVLISKSDGNWSYYITTASFEMFFYQNYSCPLWVLLEQHGLMVLQNNEKKKFVLSWLPVPTPSPSLEKFLWIVLLPLAFHLSWYMTVQKSFVLHQTSDTCPIAATSNKWLHFT